MQLIKSVSFKVNEQAKVEQMFHPLYQSGAQFLSVWPVLSFLSFY